VGAVCYHISDPTVALTVESTAPLCVVVGGKEYYAHECYAYAKNAYPEYLKRLRRRIKESERGLKTRRAHLTKLRKRLIEAMDEVKNLPAPSFQDRLDDILAKRGNNARRPVSKAARN